MAAYMAVYCAGITGLTGAVFRPAVTQPERTNGADISKVRRVSFDKVAFPGMLKRADRSGSCASGSCFREGRRSEEHTSELQSLMRISYAVFCLKKKKTNTEEKKKI